jgi:D-3-phosphoglycerate dehydrogenase / 2-oxoglutarate reductase
MKVKVQKVWITDDVDPHLISGLNQMGFEVDYEPKTTQAEVEERIGNYSGLIINSKINCHAGVLESGMLLKFVARLGSGMEIVDREVAAQKGILVISAPEGNRQAVAEHALGMLLCLINKIHIADRELRAFIWRREICRGIEISGKSIGIIGLGNTGSAFARLLRGFNCKINAHDPYLEHKPESLNFVELIDFETLVKESDIISFHVPLNAITRHMADKTMFSGLKRGCILINTSRGAVVNTNDLIEVLESGKLGGACLDVFENERVETFSIDERNMYERLYKMENTVLTPHVAGWTVESKFSIADTILKKLSYHYTLNEK